MAKKKPRQSRVSSGKMKDIRKAREAKRQAKFAAKREAGKAYEYKSIEQKLVDAGFKPKTKAYNKAYAEEKRNRIAKAKSSRSEYAIWKSMNQKLDVELAKIAAEEAFEKRKNKKAKTADAVA